MRLRKFPTIPNLQELLPHLLLTSGMSRVHSACRLVRLCVHTPRVGRLYDSADTGGGESRREEKKRCCLSQHRSQTHGGEAAMGWGGDL